MYKHKNNYPVSGVVPEIWMDVHQTSNIIPIAIKNTAKDSRHSRMELFVNQELEDIVVLIPHRVNTIGSSFGSDTKPVALKVAFK